MNLFVILDIKLNNSMHFSDEKSNFLRFETDPNTNNEKLSAFFRCSNEFRQVDNEFLKLYMPCPQNKHAQNEILRTINIEVSNSTSISISMCALHFEWNVEIWFEQCFSIFIHISSQSHQSSMQNKLFSAHRSI